MGSRARIATVCQGGKFFDSVEANRGCVMGLLDLALGQKPDLVCLPEAYTTASVAYQGIEEVAETVPGPTTSAVSQRARMHRCYIICPVLTKRDGKCWNSAIVFDRSGGIVGTYDKAHPVTSSSDYTVFERGITPGRDVPVFDLDFGRIGI
jgi:predicted amidohydrolase